MRVRDGHARSTTRAKTHAGRAAGVEGANAATGIDAYAVGGWGVLQVATKKEAQAQVQVQALISLVCAGLGEAERDISVRPPHLPSACLLDPHPRRAPPHSPPTTSPSPPLPSSLFLLDPPRRLLFLHRCQPRHLTSPFPFAFVPSRRRPHIASLTSSSINHWSGTE